MVADRIVRGMRVVRGAGAGPATIVIAGGSIIEVLDGAAHPAPEGADVVDAGDAVIMAGLVDTHVHVNQPGRTAWEGFESATAAAAAGGVTTLVDMPLNSIPATTTREALARKREETGNLRVDVGLWGGVVPGNAGELRDMIDDGVLGFKCFLIDSGVDEFRPVGRDEVVTALGILGDAGVPLLVHAELPGPIEAAARELASADPRRYRTFLESRPRRAEDEAVALALSACRETGAPIHIVHHSSADSLAALERARQDALPVSVETCPHYLHFAAEDIEDGATAYKCCPPIRERDNREQLWDALTRGVIDMVVSDHSPCTPDLKRLDAGDFMAAWGGIASLELGLSIMWTNCRDRGIGLPELSRWMSERPARMAGLANKGRIAPGFDADLVIWRPEAERPVQATLLRHRNPVTPYDGATLCGTVERTLLRGETIYQRGQLVGSPTGRLVSRTL